MAGTNQGRTGESSWATDITPVKPIASTTVLAKDFYDDETPPCSTIGQSPANVVLASAVAAAPPQRVQLMACAVSGLARAAHDFACV